jgi:3-oxoacyl-[acyl-carrier-protein] synthase III
MAENADQRCSTFLLLQWGQAIFSFSCRAMVKVFKKAFLQSRQKNS